MTDWVRRSAWVSLVSQIVLGLLSFAGFAGNVSEKSPLVLLLLLADVAVQLVEFCFYLTFLFLIRRLQTWYRYIDWFVTTPVMLITLMGFLVYLDDSSIELSTFTSAYRDDMIFVVGMNSVMLAFGACHEAGWIPTIVAIPCGTIALFLTFASIYSRVGYTTTGGILLVSFVLFVWALYGVAACLAYSPKNIMYNTLDVFAKNFFGIVVSVYLLLE